VSARGPAEEKTDEPNRVGGRPHDAGPSPLLGTHRPGAVAPAATFAICAIDSVLHASRNTSAPIRGLVSTPPARDSERWETKAQTALLLM
jgi:hypothetical protein